MKTRLIRRKGWIPRDSREKGAKRYMVDISIGKPINILSLKSDVIKDFASQVTRMRRSRTLLFNSGKTERIRKCPVCGSPTVNSRFRLNVYGGRYFQCLKCSHCFVINRPKKGVLEKFYSRNKQYFSAYTNKRAIRTRIEQVVMPKAKWVAEQFRQLYGKKPRSILDIGAGGGHFVQACRQLGIDAQGIEPSISSRKFCRDNFGFDLGSASFMDLENANVDIITFWGVIEHVPNPSALLKKARNILPDKDILVVAEVPRWDSLSSAIQRLHTDSIIRHLDPLGHINCFTDRSLCTAFEISGLTPVAAWYFGMDSYELFTQLLHLMGDSHNIYRFKKNIISMQNTVDENRHSDTLVFAGKKCSRY